MYHRRHANLRVNVRYDGVDEILDGREALLTIHTDICLPEKRQG